MNGKVYLIINLVNGKKYIGQTRQDVLKRFKEHNKKTSTTIISNALRKHGKHNFKLLVLETNIEDKNTLDLLEKEYIHLLKTLVPLGYNNAVGGFGGNRVSRLADIDLNTLAAEIAVDSTANLAIKYGVSHSTMSLFLRSNNLNKTRSVAQSVLPDSYFERIRDSYLHHKSYLKVAKDFNVSPSAVLNFLKRHDIPRTFTGKTQEGKIRKTVRSSE